MPEVTKPFSDLTKGYRQLAEKNKAKNAWNQTDTVFATEIGN
jgi:hypothetical protein